MAQYWSDLPYNIDMLNEQREMEIALDCYVYALPESRRELVREKMRTSEWIAYEEQKLPTETRIMTKIRNGDIFVEWFYGRRGEGILEITHWKPLIK